MQRLKELLLGVLVTLGLESMVNLALDLSSPTFKYTVEDHVDYSQSVPNLLVDHPDWKPDNILSYWNDETLCKYWGTHCERTVFHQP